MTGIGMREKATKADRVVKAENNSSLPVDRMEILNDVRGKANEIRTGRPRERRDTGYNLREILGYQY
jgi:hypothetical protein